MTTHERGRRDLQEFAEIVPGTTTELYLDLGEAHDAAARDVEPKPAGAVRDDVPPEKL